MHHSWSHSLLSWRTWSNFKRPTRLLKVQTGTLLFLVSVSALPPPRTFSPAVFIHLFFVAVCYTLVDDPSLLWARPTCNKLNAATDALGKFIVLLSGLCFCFTSFRAFVDSCANLWYDFQLLVFQQIEADEYIDAASHTPVVRFYGITEVSFC